MARYDSSDVVLGDEEAVKLTSVTKLTTGDSINVTSTEPRTSTPPPLPTDEAKKSLAADENKEVNSAEQSPGDNEAGAVEENEEESGETRDKKEENEGEEEGVVSKRGSQRVIQQKLERPESLEIDDQLTSNRHPRKSVLRKTNPTPVHSGPTYTCTSPVGEPYDSDGQKRSSGTRRECCSIM